MDAALQASHFAPAPTGPTRARSLRPVRLPGFALPRPCRPVEPAPVLGVVLALGVAVILVVASLRVVQAPPAEGTWQEVVSQSAADPAPVPGPHDEVITVAPGDTLWGIALRLAPGQDPRPLVSALTRANGGTLLQVGQELVIPAELLDD